MNIELEQLERAAKDAVEALAAFKSKPISHVGQRVAVGGTYYARFSDGTIAMHIERASQVDAERLAMGNYHHSKEACRAAANKQLATMRVIDALREHEGDFVIDWADEDQGKYLVLYWHEKKEFEIDGWSQVQANQDMRLISSMEAWEWVVDNMQDDLKLMWGIE